jgi:hypothetical protein
LPVLAIAIGGVASAVAVGFHVKKGPISTAVETIRASFTFVIVASNCASGRLRMKSLLASGNLVHCYTMTSGRPSAVLDDAQCQTVWKMASPNGATISRDQAVPYIVNFQMVDVDGDGQISADEFKAACGKGLVKNIKP